MLGEQTGKTEAELFAMVQQIITSREPKPPRECPECTSKVSHDVDRCQYCGNDMPTTHNLFDV